MVAGIISFFSIVQRADSGGQPIFDPSHPDANPGPRSNLDLLKRPKPNNWQIAARWPSETQSAITSAAGGGGGVLGVRGPLVVAQGLEARGEPESAVREVGGAAAVAHLERRRICMARRSTAQQAISRQSTKRCREGAGRLYIR